MNKEILHEEVRGILLQLCPEIDFSSSNDFVADGLLDSFAIAAFIANVEEKLGILVDPMDVVPENFVSFGTITNLLAKTQIRKGNF